MNTLLLLATGCLVLGATPGGGADTSAAEAFLVVQAADLTGERGVDLGQYSILVCNPSLDPGMVRARAAAGALLLGYVNPHQVPQWGADIPFFRRYRAALDDDRFYWLDAAGERASIYPNTFELRPLPEVARILAEVVSTEYRRWDGVFVDELWGEFPDWALQALPGVAAAQWDSVRTEWVRYRDEFVTHLELQPDQVVIGNVGRRPEAILDLPLDGISFEHEHLHDAADTLRFTEAFRHFRPAYCISWDWVAPDGSARPGVTWKEMEAARRRGR